MEGEKKLFVRDVGIYRVSKGDKVDEGDDAAFFSPEKRVFAVFDGIGGNGGSGSSDADRFLQILSNVNDTEEGVRQAFFSLFAPEGQSTVAMLWFPSSFHEKALMLHAGDSHCFRLRRCMDGTSDLDLLTKEHTVWQSMLENDNPVVQKVRCRLHGVFTLADLDEADENFFKSAITVLRCFARIPSQVYRDEKEELLDLIWAARATLTLALDDLVSRVKEYIGDGRLVDVSPGDRLVLLTDGIFGDVLSCEEISSILLECPSAVDAAFHLVSKSIEKNIKEDDRTALVIDIGSQSPEVPWNGVLRKSIIPR